MGVLTSLLIVLYKDKVHFALVANEPYLAQHISKILGSFTRIHRHTLEMT